MKRIDVDDAVLGTLARMLRKVEFFAPLTVGQLEHVLPEVQVRSYAAGETVFRKGDIGDAFYIVYKGSVGIRLPHMLVLSKTIATLKEGDFFGEIALVSTEPRTASVVALEPSMLFTLISEDFQFVLRENPAAAEEMKRIAARRKFNASHS